MKISLVKMPVILGSEKENRDYLRKLFKRVIEKDKPKVVLLPEMWNVGFFPPSLEEALQDGDASERLLKELAMEYGVLLIGGSIAVKEEGFFYNRCLVFSPEGEKLASYDKIHLFSKSKEEQYFTAGDQIVSFTYEGITFGLMLCYDLRFPELARSYFLREVDVLLVPAQWPRKRETHLKVLLQARAIENQCYALLSNTTSFDKEDESLLVMAVNPWGEIELDDGLNEGSLVVDIAPKRIEEVKKGMSIKNDRRGSVYETRE